MLGFSARSCICADLISFKCRTGTLNADHGAQAVLLTLVVAAKVQTHNFRRVLAGRKAG